MPSPRPRVPRRAAILATLGAGVTGSAALVLGAFAAPPVDAILPDLVADAPQRPGVENYTYANGTQALLLRFDGYVHNRGNGPLEIRASSRSGSEMTYVRQFVRTPSGAMVASDPPPGPPKVIYETDDSHNHWHLREIARYSLWNQARTAEVAPAQKTGFCLIDSERRETVGPTSAVYTEAGNRFCGQNEPTRSSLTMGVSAGWRDLYHRYLAFQWVDVSNVQPGVYWVAAEIDTDNVIAESDEANNTRVFAGSSNTVPGYRARAVSANVPFGGSGAVTLASDSFGSPGSRRFRIQTLPANGQLRSGTTTLGANAVVTGDSVTYVPNAGYSGTDSFSYTAFDSTSPYPRTPAPATATVEVGTSQQASVAISGAPQTMLTGASVTLSATVTNATVGVTWSVNGVTGGNATVGTITSGGLYTAPASVPAGGTVTIRATSVSQPAAFDEEVVAIQAAPPPDPSPQPGTNLVTNPSFEAGTTGWGTWNATLSRVTLPDAPNGVAVALVQHRAGTAFTIDDVPETVLSATAGQTYTSRAFVRAASSSSVGKRARLVMREWSPSGTQVQRVVSAPVTLSTTFQELNVQLTAQAAGDEVDVHVLHESAATGNAMYVDQVSMVAGSGGTPPPPPPNQAPSASFTVAPASPVVGETVTFTDTSTDADGTVASRVWDLDDDGQFNDASGVSATRSFAATGTYTVRVRVTDDGGLTSTASRTVTVGAPPTAGANLVANPSFETSLTGWTSWQATRTRVQVADAPDGSWAVRVAQSSGTQYTLDDNPTTVASAPAGAVYTARAQVRADSASAVGDRVTLQLRERTASGSTVRTVPGPAVFLTNAFQPVAVSITPAAGNSVEVIVGQSPAAAGDAMLVDAVSLERTS